VPALETLLAPPSRAPGRKATMVHAGIPGLFLGSFWSGSHWVPLLSASMVRGARWMCGRAAQRLPSEAVQDCLMPSLRFGEMNRKSK
jgi:hypothetical protein